eukprot:3296561-Pleurochrysis_carterae.AAC.2
MEVGEATFRKSCALGRQQELCGWRVWQERASGRQRFHTGTGPGLPCRTRRLRIALARGERLLQCLLQVCSCVDLCALPFAPQILIIPALTRRSALTLSGM